VTLAVVTGHQQYQACSPSRIAVMHICVVFTSHVTLVMCNVTLDF